MMPVHHTLVSPYSVTSKLCMPNKLPNTHLSQIVRTSRCTLWVQASRIVGSNMILMRHPRTLSSTNPTAAICGLIQQKVLFNNGLSFTNTFKDSCGQLSHWLFALLLNFLLDG